MYLVRAVGSLDQNSAAYGQLNDTLGSQIQTIKLQISALSSRMDAVGSQVNAVQSQIVSLSSRMDTFGSQIQTVQSRVNALSSARSVTRCRLCFREIEGSSQCQRSRNSCSGWSNSPSWTSPFRDDTDGRGGGCTYQWLVECA